MNNFTLKIKGKAPQPFDTLPNAFLAANRATLLEKETLSVEGPFKRTYNWQSLLRWAKDADVIDREGNINKRALKRKY